MKKILYAALIPAALLLSCNGNNGSGPATGADTTAVSSDTSTSRMDVKDNSSTKMNDTAHSAMAGNKTISDKDVTDFVQKASAGGMMEVDLGNYAAKNAQSQRVKDFGTMMVTDHSAANSELKTMATSNNITVPDALKSDQQMHVDMLKKKTGAAFDKAYMDMMLNDHKTDVNEFKKASTGLTDASYKAFAAKTLPVLQKHLDSAQAIHKSM